MTFFVTFALLLLSLTACGSDPAVKPSLGTTKDTASSGDTQADSAVATSCKSNSDCLEPIATCDPLTKQCVDCLFEADCGPQQHCVAKSCVTFTPCKNSLDCTSAKAQDGGAQGICDTAKNECVACLTTADCPADFSCKNQACVPFKTCANSTDCDADQVCGPTLGRCVACNTESDCAENQVCEKNQCRSYLPCFSDKQCTPAGLLCDTKAGKCARCLQNSDCPDIYHCAPTGPAGTGLCKLDICQPGEGSCENSAIVQCNSTGDAFTSPSECAPETTCMAANGKAECKPWACKPGLTCDGAKAVQCSQDGLAIEQSTDCAADGKLCDQGACVAPVCSPNTLFCQGNAVQGCAEDGLIVSLVKTCTAQEYCSDGACKAQACAPNMAYCQKNTVKLCDALGSGPTADPGKDCGTQFCVAGQCKSAICDANKAFCDGQVVKTCAADGMSGTLVKTCTGSEICDAGACKAKICIANSATCDGNTVKMCNANGTAVTGPGTDCGAQKCVGGVCKALICMPNAKTCSGGKLQVCAADGLSYVSETACGVGTYCGADKNGVQGCQAMVCNPGQPACDGTKAAVCNAEGSGFAGNSTDCAASGKVCSAGTCVALKCDPQNPLYCNGNVAMKCDATGLNPTTLQTCGATQYCDKGVCQAQVCVPNAAGCNGNVAATCNAQGSGWLAGGTDCAAAGKACQAGTCVATQTCGNGKVEGNEACDDGNLKDGDGCSATCKLQSVNVPVTSVLPQYNSALRGYWRFDGDFKDSSGVGNDAVAHGQPSFVAGNIGSAVHLGGTGDYMTFTKSVWPAANSFTFAGWIRFANVKDGALFSFGPQNGCSPSTSILRVESGALRTFVGCGTATGYSPATLAKDVWTHIVLTRDATNQDTLFVNGVKVLGPTNVTGGSTMGVGNDVLGTQWGSGIISNYLNGDLHEIAVWSGVVLSAADVAGLYSLTKVGGGGPICGNAVKDAGEGCDDGNSANGDGCSASCLVESTWKLVFEGSMNGLPSGGTAQNGACFGQGPGTIANVAGWKMTSDHNNIWFPVPSVPDSSGSWAAEVDLYFEKQEQRAGFGFGSVWIVLAGTGPLGAWNLDPNSVTISAGKSLQLFQNKTPYSAWTKLRIEKLNSNNSAIFYMNGAILGSLTFTPADMVNTTTVNMGGNGTCPSLYGFSNFKFFTQL